MSACQHTPYPMSALAVERGASVLAESEGHAQKLAGIGRFANVIAHDFNNLLSVIRMYAEMALRERTLTADLREQLEAICGAADSAAWLSQQLLAHTRRNSGRSSALDLNLMLRDVHQLLGRSLPAGTTAELRLQENLPPIVADPGPVGQVLLSVVAQVMEGLPAGGRLLIESSQQTRAPQVSSLPMGSAPHGEVHVRVSGTASGFGAPMADAFGTLPRPRPAAPTHAIAAPISADGAALAAAAEIVRALQGTISVTGDAHSGWVIDIALPGTSAPPVLAERAASASEPRPATDRLRT